VTDEELALLALLLRRPRSRLKTYARMRKRDRMFSAWAQQNGEPMAALTNAVRFALEEPLLEADAEERALLGAWWATTSAKAAREVLPQYAPLRDATALARDDALVRIATGVRQVRAARRATDAGASACTAAAASALPVRASTGAASGAGVGAAYGITCAYSANFSGAMPNASAMLFSSSAVGRMRPDSILLSVDG
jgi:hypothetical protein